MSQKTVKRLNALVTTYAPNQSPSGQDEPYYKYLNNWEAYLNEVKKIVASSKSDLLMATTARGIKRGHMFNFHSLLKRMQSRGITIRIATELSDENRDYLIKLNEFAEVRHVPGIKFKALVCDGKVACLCPRFDDSLNPLYNYYFVFRDVHTAQTIYYLLHQVWSVGRPVLNCFK
ncbi:MAG: hypothetical protein QXV84_01370 [Conexivisphaerales archaeon]